MSCEFDRGTNMAECEEARESLVASMSEGSAGFANFLTERQLFGSRPVTARDVLEIAARIGMAPIIYWRHEILSAATSGWEIWQDHAPDPNPLMDRQVWLFEKSWIIHAAREGGRTRDVILAYIDYIREANSILIALACHERMLERRCRVYWTFTSADIDSPSFCGRNIGELAAAMAFMKLRIASVERQQPPRHVRRQLERAGKAVPDVRVVTLRRKESKEAGIASDVNWSCQWIVGGHWRNQWYESRQTHEPVYILPYLKGPQDKPLRVPKQVLYKVAK